jgi:adenosylcobyric acid synthase
MKKNIMVLGTASSAGKSLLVTALCRIFFQDGNKVAPFKSQNMSLNSFITDEGLEMGRAQVVQAEASNIKPKVCMNPILLKPTGEHKSQVIIEGKVFDNYEASDYYKFKDTLKEIVQKNYKNLENDYDVIVLEGAGSPVEINLKQNDIVNMGMAEIADAPVILVADIDRGGVFASIVGTIFLLDENEKKRVKGVVINKFRGDLEILKPGLKMLEEIIKIPILGVIPYLDIQIEDEDSLTDKFIKTKSQDRAININIIKLPHISNFTDMNVFSLFEDVTISYIENENEINDPDIVIIPGSKNSIDDMIFLKEKKLDKKIIDLCSKDKFIVGICGGFQMLGRIIEDPFHIESDIKSINGLNLLDIKTKIQKEKTTKQIKGKIISETGIFKNMKRKEINGYEIHMGESEGRDGVFNFMEIEGKPVGIYKNNILGTYIHGIFDNDGFTNALLNSIRLKKGLTANNDDTDYRKFKDHEYDRLADIIRKSIDMTKIYEILNKKEL